MKKLMFIVLFGMLFSCSKEDCKNYEAVVESNSEAAFDKCDGFANSYPAFQVLSKRDLGCLLDDEVAKLRSTTENSSSVPVCTGVTATTKTTIRLK